MTRKSSDEWLEAVAVEGVFKCFPSSIFLDNLLAQLTENSFLDKPWLIHLELSIAGIVNSHRSVHRWGSPGHHKTPYTKSLHPFLSSCFFFCWHPSFLSSTHKSTDPHILPCILLCILPCILPCILLTILPHILPCSLTCIPPCIPPCILLSILPCILPCTLTCILPSIYPVYCSGCQD